MMDNYANNSLQNIPLAGMTLAVRRAGKPDWLQAYGYANLEQSIPATPDTVYPIGSLTMQFTAAAVMQLVERGQLDLNVPINQYLEGLPPELQFFTLRQLLSQTSMIYDSVDTQERFGSPLDYTPEAILQVLVPTFHVDQSSGLLERSSYGNYILAGLIIEKVSGLSYSDYLYQNIFAPAGLQRTSYCLPGLPNQAQGYYLPSNQFETAPINLSAVYAAGGLCSTAGDLLLWIDALTSGRVVSPASYRMMITPAQTLDGTSYQLGFGLYLMQDQFGMQVDSIGVEISPFSFIISYPEKGLVIILLSNTYKSDSSYFEKIFSLIPALMSQ